MALWKATGQQTSTRFFIYACTPAFIHLTNARFMQQDQAGPLLQPGTAEVSQGAFLQQ